MIQEFSIGSGTTDEKKADSFCNWLIAKGFTLVQNSRGPSGYSIRVLARGRLVLQLFSERSGWTLVISNDPSNPLVGNWFQVEVVMEYLRQTPFGNLTFGETLRVVAESLEEIEGLFSREDFLHVALPTLRNVKISRENRLYRWPPIVREFQAFLISLGFESVETSANECEHPSASILMTDGAIAVRISRGRYWQMRVGSALLPMHPYNDIRNIRLLLKQETGGMRFYDWFLFAKANWEQIARLFCADCVEETTRRLAAVLAKN